MEICRSTLNESASENIAFEENTYKHLYYYPPLSDDDELPSYSPKRSNESIDEFFTVPAKKKIKTKRSSTVGRPNKDSITYVSTNTDDGAVATHLIKIEVYELKKLENVDQSQHWQHADVRVKYYTKPNNDIIHKKTRQIIYDITKGISNAPDSNKYTMRNKQ